jgi:hypothetical protein
MFKFKTTELPIVPKLTDFPKYQQIAASAETKHKELQACQGRLTALGRELLKFDVSDVNHRKRSVQRSIASEKEIELQLQKELAGLDVLRQRVVSEISREFSRKVDAAVRGLLEQLCEAQASVSTLETTYLDYVGKIEASGLNVGHLSQPFHLSNLGRQTDTNSLISQILKARGVWEAVVSAAPLKQKSA